MPDWTNTNPTGRESIDEFEGEDEDTYRLSRRLRRELERLLGKAGKGDMAANTQIQRFLLVREILAQVRAGRLTPEDVRIGRTWEYWNSR